jgi:hypothetical protein
LSTTRQHGRCAGTSSKLNAKPLGRRRLIRERYSSTRKAETAMRSTTPSTTPRRDRAEEPHRRYGFPSAVRPSSVTDSEFCVAQQEPPSRALLCALGRLSLH